MRFSKLYAAGKDYILIDAVHETQPHLAPALSRAICNRHFGAGADGMLVVEPSKRADVRVAFFQADGLSGRVEPIGVGCAAAFAVQRNIAGGPQLRMEIGPNIDYVTVDTSKGKPTKICVDLGPPTLQADRIPATLPGNPPVEVPVTFPDTMYNVTAVAMTTPYAVIFVRELSDTLVHDIGSQMEKHPGFPQRTSVAFVRVHKPDNVSTRIWERDIGEVSASGTGAAAVAVAGALSGRSRRQVNVHFPVGDVEIDWKPSDNHVYLTCAVTEVYRAEWRDRS